MERSSRITLSRSYSRWVYFSTRPAVSVSIRPTQLSTVSSRPVMSASIFSPSMPAHLHKVLHRLGRHGGHIVPQLVLVHLGLPGHQHVGEPGQQARRHVVFDPKGLGHIPQRLLVAPCQVHVHRHRRLGGFEVLQRQADFHLARAMRLPSSALSLLSKKAQLRGMREVYSK